MSFATDPNFTVELAIRRWVLEECDADADASLVVHLREIILGIARTHLASGPAFPPPRHLEADDLATEFLLHLRKQGNWMIRTKAGLKAEYRRWVTAFSSPAHHELWEILSAALHSLAKDSSAWRLDAPADNHNHNAAIWTGVAGDTGALPCDLAKFETTLRPPKKWGRRNRQVKTYSPRAALDWHPEGAVLPKLIAPSDAKKLALDLLHAAAGSLRFRDLLEEFTRCVFTFDQSGEKAPEGQASAPWIHEEAWKRIHVEAHKRADLIWNAVSAVQSTDLLCDYFIPKHLEERSVTLENFGDPRRVHERLKRMVECLRQHLALNDVAEKMDIVENEAPLADKVDAAFYGRFVIEAMHILCEKCARRPGKTAASALPIEQTP